MFVNADPYGAGISKRYSSYSLHPISAKLYVKVSYHGGIQAVTFLDTFGQVLKLSWHFWVNGKILKCAITRNSLIVGRNESKFGTRRPMKSICSVLFMSDSFSSVWGHSVHFAKFLMLRFRKIYCSHSVHPISIKLYGKYVIKGDTSYCFIWRITKCRHFEFFC